MLNKSSLERTLSHEDIVTGNNEWLNIQDIVRLTFKQMANTLNNQDRAIRELERQLSVKASRSEVQSLISHKCDTEDFHIEINNLRSLIQAIRSDTSDLICASREDYVNDYRKIIAELENKANKADVKGQLNEIDYQRSVTNAEIKELKKDIEGKIQVVKNQVAIDIDYSREMNMIEFDKILEGNKAILNEISFNKRNSEEIADELSKRICSVTEDIDLVTKLQIKSEEEIEKHIDSSLGMLRNEILQEVSSITDNINKIFRDLEQTKTVKADTSHVFSLISIKSEEISRLREEISYLTAQIKTKTPYQDFEKEVKGIKEILESWKKESNLKFDKKFSEVQENLDTKVNKDDHHSNVNKQDAINETLCSENTIGRWYIENKRDQRGEVSWEFQSVNTCPENFIWQKHNSGITVVSSGCYEVNLGFYSGKKPLVQVYANNELVFSLVNCAS